ncbi:MAG: DEAD/DEAH box helicase [Crocinitomicaceae bacterium]|nr:DEAD/DEAH box helicase [Crocinitomicaceae bacterium]
MKFQDLDIIQPIQDALREKNYEEPTPIQEQAIPLVLKGKDLLGCAQTGTGKTAAFSIPMIQNLQASLPEGQKHRKIRGLILTPTRELAIQIGENIKEYSKYTRINHTVIFGGVKQGAQVNRLSKGVDILVATPGRLLDLIQQRIIHLADIEIFVLDEADRMLDMGFINDIKKVLKLLPRKRQSLFFSATMPDNILKLSQEILFKPEKVEVTPAATTAETIRQFIYYTNRDTKKNLLRHIIKDNEMDQVLVFARTKHGSDRIARDLNKKDIKAAAIHGDKAQNQRQKTLSQFKNGQLTVLVATDIAARGIDIDKLKWVINYDIPDQPETYVHRIGRCGRAGEEGIAIAISEPEENVYVKAVERLTKEKLEEVEDNPFPQTEKPMTAKEKKEWNKEKMRKRQEYFDNRKKKPGNGNRRKKR